MQNRVRCAPVPFAGLASRVCFHRPQSAPGLIDLLILLLEYIYGTTIQHNYNVGWGVMTLSSYDVFQQSRQLPGFQTSMLGQILSNETDPLFSWQYNEVSLLDVLLRNAETNRDYRHTRAQTIARENIALRVGTLSVLHRTQLIRKERRSSMVNTGTSGTIS